MCKTIVCVQLFLLNHVAIIIFCLSRVHQNNCMTFVIRHTILSVRDGVSFWWRSHLVLCLPQHGWQCTINIVVLKRLTSEKHHKCFRQFRFLLCLFYNYWFATFSGPQINDFNGCELYDCSIFGSHIINFGLKSIATKNLLKPTKDILEPWEKVHFSNICYYKEKALKTLQVKGVTPFRNALTRAYKFIKPIKLLIKL